MHYPGDAIHELEPEVYRCILGSLSEAVCALDLQERIICFNREAQDLMKVSCEEALGASLQAVFQHQAVELRSWVTRVRESGKPIRGEAMKLTNRKAQSIPVVFSTAPVFDKKGMTCGVVILFQDNRPIEILRRELKHTYTAGDIVTKDKRMRQILANLQKVAESDSTVLLHGPTGTGKELFARSIHASSRRRKGPFVAINCTALPDTLLESELFGYRKGAFTDAKRDKRGQFTVAEKGTLLLDEIGDISPAMQAKLLRVIEEKEYLPLGATSPRKANVRILAATNRELQKMVDSGTFRSDLYYRLNVVEFHLPPLYERPSDIPLLIEHFMEVLNAEHGRRVHRISHDAMMYLMHYSYPGNVRELRNIIEHAFVLCKDDEIEYHCLPARVLHDSNPSRTVPVRLPVAIPLRRMPPEEQRSLIHRILEEQDGHRAKTAQVLGIDKSTLWRKIKKYKIE